MMEIPAKQIEIESMLDRLARYRVPQGAIEKLKAYMRANGFYSAYASYRHHVYEGGLADHSLGVYHKMWPLFVCPRTRIVVGLLHDIFKAGRYIPYKGKHHGIASVKVLDELGFPLRRHERRAIKWHMWCSPRGLSSGEFAGWLFNKFTPTGFFEGLADMIDSVQYRN